MYLKHKIPFEFEVQNDTMSIKSGMGSYTTRYKNYTIEEINFIKAVKHYIIKNELQLKYAGRKNNPVMYFKYNKTLKPGQVFDKCVNIDLTSAYWETANMLGLLSKELYLQGKQVRKQVRLAAIGSLAKKKRVYVFDGVKQKLKYIQRNENTEFLWDIICDHVANVLLATAEAVGHKFIFFWVDGIYVQKGAEGLVEKFFSHAGFGYKTNGLQKIEILNKNIYVYPKEPIVEIKDGKETTRHHKPFPFRNKKISKTFKGANRDL